MSATLIYFKSRLQRLFAQLRYLPRLAVAVWDATARISLFWVFLLILQGLLPIAIVCLSRALVNELVVAMRIGGDYARFNSTLVLGECIAGVTLLEQLLRCLASWVRTMQSELVKDHIAGLIQKKSMEVDLSFYDSSSFYDRLHRARAEASYRPGALLENVGSLIQGGITLAAMLGVLIPFGPILPLILLASAAPVCYVLLKAAHRRHQWNQRTTTENRRSLYFDELLTAGESAAEMRSYGLGEHFRRCYDELRSRLRQDKAQVTRREAWEGFLAGFAALSLVFITMGWMLWRATRGLVSLGDMALFYQAFNRVLAVARGLLDNAGQLYENTLFLGNLFEFLDLRIGIVGPEFPTPLPASFDQGIQFDGISFRYPGSANLALCDFTMSIEPGQIVALVGPNGAGKTTIARLLCRFYDPEIGTIRINGIPLNHLSLEQLRLPLAVHFQLPVQYNATARSNIWYGDINAPPDGFDHRVEDAAQDAGAREFLSAMPQAFETQLGRWFLPGYELSIGQWQRVGLARAFFRNAPIIVLDEPTSAMDPWAEIEWAKGFRTVAKGRIAIIITHRFTTAMFADVIHVVSEGRIVESGTHVQLLRKDGMYASGWADQSMLSRV